MKRRISHQINEIAHNLASVCFITKYHVLFERYSDRADQKEFKDVKKSKLLVFFVDLITKKERTPSFVVVLLSAPPCSRPLLAHEYHRGEIANQFSLQAITGGQVQRVR